MFAKFVDDSGPYGRFAFSLADNGGVEITDKEYATARASLEAGQILQPDANGRPVAVDRPAPTDEEVAAQVRAERDRLLAACDWTQLADCALDTTAIAAWATYRHALRDVPEQSDFPDEVTWPQPPVVE